ncbi:MAG: NOL1/NOP2/sun family putative RNA methylase [Erysipelotrichaceae bacterium]|nr:NOL1/NOP2/sun family putative RNA methylase [Erysipelotrichaceae bacterium]
MNILLPEAYRQKMKALLGDEYDSYLESFSVPACRGFRINPLKTNRDEFFSLTPFTPSPSPFAVDGYYLIDDIGGVGALPAHAAGMFYLQEPSASCAVTILDPKPGMRVLDLCAAPGSKTTQIGALMKNQGLLVANEINGRRAAVLKENVERFGLTNCLILNSDPSLVAKQFAGYFDAVLCDAPCSGEGMFRKDPDAIRQWHEETEDFCAQRQRPILEAAYQCLASGGTLVYSTCTFALAENEENVQWLLQAHPDLKLVDAGVSFGRPGVELGCGTHLCRRIYPMDGGEGHFAAKFVKDGTSEQKAEVPLLKTEQIKKEASAFLSETFPSIPYVYSHGDSVYGGSFPFIDPGKCRIIRHQVLLGEMKSGRFEPAHAVYMTPFAYQGKTVDVSDEETARFLRGETLTATGIKGWAAVSWHGHRIGFDKGDGSILKNRYPKNLRTR